MTMIELLVVIAVIAILIALLMPAVVAARGAARRSQCTNNLRQLGSAVQQFHSRMDSLPAYWGGMKGGGGEVFGGWLLHMLPELDQQAFYDALPTSGAADRYVWTPDPSGEIIPAIPRSADYDPGNLLTTTGTVTANGVQIVVVKTEVVNRKGSPGYPARRKGSWVKTGSITTGVPAGFGTAQQQLSLNFLQCYDDPSTAQPGERIAIQHPTWGTANWSLTNYVANAHAFMKFGANGQRYLASGSSTANGSIPAGGVQQLSGLFLPPASTSGNTGVHAALSQGSWPGTTGTSQLSNVFTNSLAQAHGPRPRQFGHFTDGLSNTILFAEAMRQCEGGVSYRFAFLPCGYPLHEHGFGIEPTFSGTGAFGDGTVVSGTLWAGTGFLPWIKDWGNVVGTNVLTMGNTIMFQTRPTQAGCNNFRVQANHGNALMTVMADGSTRAISSAVSRRETVSPLAAGRENFVEPGASLYYSAESRGAVLAASSDGIWDMLMVPNDPPTNVLSNTGEVGKER